VDACSYCEDIGGKLGALVRLFNRLCVVSRRDWAMLPIVVAFVLSGRAVDDCIVDSAGVMLFCVGKDWEKTYHGEFAVAPG